MELGKPLKTSPAPFLKFQPFSPALFHLEACLRWCLASLRMEKGRGKGRESQKWCWGSLQRLPQHHRRTAGGPLKAAIVVAGDSRQYSDGASLAPYLVSDFFRVFWSIGTHSLNFNAFLWENAPRKMKISQDRSHGTNYFRLARHHRTY